MTRAELEKWFTIVKNWLAVLKGDKRAIFTAATEAQQAVDWLLKSQNQLEAA